MATTSNTYLFGTNTQVDDLFREAYERIGIIGNDLTPLNVQSAIMSANLELASWPGKGLNLWLIQRDMFDVFPLQPIYQLPLNMVRILEVVAIQPLRILGGTAASSNGGVPANCFDPNSTAGCTQVAPNGNISYDFGMNNAYSILYAGVCPLTTTTYTLVVEYSFDGITWQTPYKAPTQQYLATQTTWFVIDRSVNARYWRIRETNGATLSIQQIYFSQPTNNGVGDRLLGPISRSEWMAISNKMSQGFPSGFYFDETINPTMVLFPVPSANIYGNATNILYTNYRYAQDVTQMFQTMEIPQRFYDALVAGLASRLSLKFVPDRYQMLKLDAQEAYMLAAKTDFENVTLRFQPDTNFYRG